MKKRVLLIDDDRLQFRVTQAHFAAFQHDAYELEWAATYEEGLARLRSGEFAACLLDFQLGARDGLQLIREAIAEDCRTPIVFLTAETADRVDIDAMNAGALDYLVKGEITPRMLERSLRYALKLGETLDALRRLATRDELTGLLNRREFDRILLEEQERALRFGQSIALIIVDVDHFKAVNDEHGHPIGDLVLQEIARRLGREVRSVDRVARLGGEEFGVILVQSDEEAARMVAERMGATMREHPVAIREGALLPVTVSAGIASLPRHARSASALISAADKALYAAKSAGRNRAVIFRNTEE
jgi:two-component system cell cycle response regulator